MSVMATLYRKPDCIIQPWQHGHGETKTTCLWLKNLPKLEPTQIVEGRESRVHRMPPSETRAEDRSRTYPGIAAAMATQWGGLLSQLQITSGGECPPGGTARGKKRAGPYNETDFD